MRRGGVTLALALVASLLALGCMTPEEKHRVLTFFFDGVPPLASEEPVVAEAPEEPAEAAEAAVPAPVQRADYSHHKAYSERQCQECHKSRFSNLLPVPKEELCWKCHERKDFPGKFEHGPMAGGDCTGCHSPHDSPNPDLLVLAPSAICSRCHDRTTFADIDEHTAKEGDDCLRCHNPHAADRDYLLRDSIEVLRGGGGTS